jgi:L-seryl-tRNA(Ser) seleniumtransferase
MRMSSSLHSSSISVFRGLPSVDELLRSPVGMAIQSDAGSKRATDIARSVINELRLEITGSNQRTDPEPSLLSEAERRFLSVWESEERTAIKRVINATGVILHTNLGRAPLSEAAKAAVVDHASGYCSLEYDLSDGSRSKRGRRAEKMLAGLTGAEDVLIVNNCAAAAFFVLTAFAAGGEVMISRGELVEIGGDFRIPDVLEQSGATLREVGTTNRTKLTDHKKAISEKTRMILKVHPSNYRIVGFTATPTLEELSGFARENKILLYEDLGSGAMIDLSGISQIDEPTVRGSISGGADIVTFSGDKLLGGPQAGIIAGKAQHIVQLRKHPLYRALRVDKMVLSALEATLGAYRRETAVDEIPVLKMLARSKDEIAARLQRVVKELGRKGSEITDLKFEIIDGISAIGGGAAPTARLETKLLALTHKTLSASRLEHLLRNSDPPVIARIVGNRVLIDLRTVPENDERELLEILRKIGHR